MTTIPAAEQHDPSGWLSEHDLSIKPPPSYANASDRARVGVSNVYATPKLSELAAALNEIPGFTASYVKPREVPQNVGAVIHDPEARWGSYLVRVEPGDRWRKLVYPWRTSSNEAVNDAGVAKMLERPEVEILSPGHALPPVTRAEAAKS